MEDDEPHLKVLADAAMGAAAEAFTTVLRASSGLSQRELHAAWQVLFQESLESAEGASDERTWVRHAAMELLIGAQSREAGAAERPAQRDELETGWDALVAGRLEEAMAIANDAITAEREAGDDADGHVLHEANLLLGYVALERGDDDQAEHHLLAAGEVPSAPALASFGPNMSLARALLRRGRTRAVIEYFDRCGAFWGPLPTWRGEVEAAEMPSFGPNLIYYVPEQVSERY